MFGLYTLKKRLTIQPGSRDPIETSRGLPNASNEPSTGDSGFASRNPVPLWWQMAMWGVLALWVVLQLPYGYGLASFLYYDSGWALATNELLSEGLIPTQDFAYFYGLLTLLIDRVWFAAFGATPFSQAALSLLCAAASTHASIRFACAVRLRRPARWLLLVCAPLAIMPSFYHTPTHALEYALLINALALQAGGRSATALLLATVCLFIKPALAAIYGPVLAGIIIFGPRPLPTSLARRSRELLPAAIIALAIAGLLAARFGLEPLLATLVPLDASKLYTAEKYGFFFGIGRQFWFPDALSWWYYPNTQAGFWLVGTLSLLLGAVRAVRFGRGPGSATLVTCAFLHLVFVVFLFGNEMSWMYYSYMLVFGLCGVVDRVGLPARDESERRDRVRIGLLILLGAMGQSYRLLICLAMLVNGLTSPVPSRTPTTAGLMANQDDQKSWAHVREIASRDRVLVLSPVGAARALMPEIDSPDCWYFLPQIARSVETERIARQIEAADWLVIPVGPGIDHKWHEAFRPQLAAFRIVEMHPSFQLARRRPEMRN